MQPDLPTLLLAHLVLAAGVSLLMTAWGLHRPVPRGYWAWVAAPALAAVGAALQLMGQGPPLRTGLGLWLLLLWPLAALQGLRRFDTRGRLPGSPGGDALLAGLAALWALGMEMHAVDALADAHGAVLAGALQACTALLLWRARALRHSAVLRSLTFTLAVGAALQLGAAALALRGLDWAVPAALLLNALLGTAVAGVAPLLAQERAEYTLREARRRLHLLGRRELLDQGSSHFDVLAQRLLRREPREAAVLVFDIDRQGGAANEEKMHARLRLVAHCVHATLRGHDLAGRHGGEFVLLLPGTTLRDAMAAAARIVVHAQALAATQALSPLSLSFGVGQLRAGEALAQGLQRAQEALAEARRQGFGRAVGAAANGPEPVFVESRRLGLKPM